MPDHATRLPSAVELLKGAFKEWQEDKVPRLAAALSYYTIFSLAPLLVLAVVIAGLAFGEQAAEGRIVAELEGLIGPQGAELLEGAIRSARNPTSSMVASVFGLGALLLGASGVFGQLQDALNTVWEVAPKPGAGLKGLVKKRVLSFTSVLAIGFLLLVSLLLSAGISAAGRLLGERLSALLPALEAVNFLVSLAVVTVLFAFMFKYLPDVRISWRNVWVGAWFTSFLFVVGKTLIGIYLGTASPGSAYGVASTLVILLLWIYYSSVIFLFGAEFTQVYARHSGTRIVPSPGAVALSSEARARQGIPRSTQVEHLARPSSQAPPVEPPRVSVALAFLLGWIIRGTGSEREPKRPR